ncbi:hypothetical protein B1810_21395 [Panacagrimonas perspica]|nr:hypothetical protein B1810_21395 [Panacagrimonas perspica]
MLAEDLGPRAEIRRVLETLLHSLKWISGEGTQISGEAIDPRYDSAYRLSLHENESGAVCFITTTNHASPQTLSVIMDRFSLNYCCTDFGDFRQPHRCDDNWNVVNP